MSQWNEKINSKLLNTVDKSIQDIIPHWITVKPSKETLTTITQPNYQYRVALAIRHNDACLVIFDERDQRVCIVEEWLSAANGTTYRHWMNTRTGFSHASSERYCFHQGHCNDIAEKLLKQLVEERFEEIIFGKK